MSIKEQIDRDLIEAMKARDTDRVSTIRMIRSAIKNREIDGRVEMDDDGVIATLTSMAKQHKDSIEQFEKGGRADLVESEKKGLAIVQGYLPAQMGEDEIRAAIAEVIAETGAAGPADMGKVMKAVMPKLKGRADGKVVKELLTGMLGS